MAKNIGLIKFSGSLGNLVGYYRGKQYIVQRKGGPTAERLKTDACYEDVRKRQTEFGHCSKISSMFRVVFEDYLQYIPGRMVYNWIQSQVMGIKNCDLVSEKGSKTFSKGLETEAGKHLFRSFVFNQEKGFRQVVHFQNQAVLETGSLSFELVSPKNFTNGVVGVSLVVLSADFDSASCSVYSEGLVLFDRMDGMITLTTPLPEEAGFWIAFLYVVKGVPSGDGYVWLRDKGNVLGVVDFKKC